MGQNVTLRAVPWRRGHGLPLFLAGVCLAIAAVFALLVLLPGGSERSGQGRASAAGGLTRSGLMQGMGIYFYPASDSGAEQPLLPDGQKAVTRTQAVGTALGMAPAARDGRLLPGVQMQVQFGLFSDGQLSRRSPSGNLERLFQNRPVWLSASSQRCFYPTFSPRAAHSRKT